MPALPSSVIDPLWDQFAALLSEHVDTHPLGCHRPRIPDRVILDKLVHVLVWGAAYERIADGTCSATSIRNRRDEWITAGVFERLEQICLDAYDRIVGLELGDLTVDGCLVKAPCGGEAAGKSPVDRGKQGTKRSVLTDGHGIPLGCVVASANRHDSPLLRPTLEKLGRFGSTCPHDHRAPRRRLRQHPHPRPAGQTGLSGWDQQEGLPAAGRSPVGGRACQLLAQPRLQETPGLHRTPYSRHRRPHRVGQRNHHRPQTHPPSLDHPPLAQRRRILA